MKRTSILSFCLILLTAASAWSQANTTVSWGNFSLDSATQAAVLFRDSSGVALSQGVATSNTDGMLVQLGYYSASTAANNFAGNWIPITGFGPSLHTAIGDSANLSGSGNGIIDFNTVFGGAFLNSMNVQVYATGDPGTYTTQSSVPITTTTPPNGQIMSIRFYDTTTGQTGNYNAVSADDWTWQIPTTTGGGAIASYQLADAFQGFTAALEFQSFASLGAAGDFRTVIAIPEPATYALLIAGLAGVAFVRRRFKLA